MAFALPRPLSSRAEQPSNLIQQLVRPNRPVKPATINRGSSHRQTTAFEADTGRSALGARTAVLGTGAVFRKAGGVLAHSEMQLPEHGIFGRLTGLTVFNRTSAVRSW